MIYDIFFTLACLATLVGMIVFPRNDEMTQRQEEQVIEKCDSILNNKTELYEEIR